MKLMSSATLCILSASIFACSSGGGGGKASNSSAAGTSSSASSAAVASHNPGLNCMSCHDGAGTAPRFRAAGTVYRSGGSQPLVGATVRLYLHNTNTVSAALVTDSLGNFYTRTAVDGLSDGSGALVTGVDVEIEGPGGAKTTMPGVVSNGSCNSCHGQSNGRITAQ